MTVCRLILDLARRRWKSGLFWLGFQPFNMAGITLHKDFPVSVDGLAIGILTTVFLQLGALRVFDLRELYQLPVSRKTWWRALWVVRAILFPGIAGIAIGLRQLESFVPVWSDRCIVYAVTLMIAASAVIRVGPALFKLGVTKDGQGVSSSIVAQAATTIGALPFGLLLFISPFFFAPYLPHVLRDFNVWWIIGYAIAAAFGFASYFRDPEIVARTVIRPATSRQMPHGPYRMPGDAPREEHLTGLRLAFYAQARRRVIGIGVAIVGAAVYWAIASVFRPMPSLPEAFIRVGFLPFAEPRLDLAFLPLPLVLGVVVMADMSARPLNLLLLRTIPMAAWRVASLPILTGIATATAIYATQVGLYVITGHLHFVTWRIDLLVVASATVALVDLVRLVSRSSGVAVVLVLMGVPLFRTDLHTIVPQSTYLAAGLALLTLTWIASWYLVTRSSYAYRQTRLRSRTTDAIPQL